MRLSPQRRREGATWVNGSTAANVADDRSPRLTVLGLGADRSTSGGWFSMAVVPRLPPPACEKLKAGSCLGPSVSVTVIFSLPVLVQLFPIKGRIGGHRCPSGLAYLSQIGVSVSLKGYARRVAGRNNGRPLFDLRGSRTLRVLFSFQ